MPRSFEILEHTADIGVRVSGTTLPEMFVGAALAVESVALETDRVEARFDYPISAAGDDTDSLLVNWLNEIIYHLDGRRVVMSQFAVETLTGREITGHGWGEPRDPIRHPPRLVVKAATYHQLRIRHSKGLYIAEVYLDI